MTVGFIVAARSSVRTEQCDVHWRYWEILYFFNFAEICSNIQILVKTGQK